MAWSMEANMRMLVYGLVWGTEPLSLMRVLCWHGALNH